MAEYCRVGLDAARVEDIVAAAGVSWGTFFHYFPAKEDVLLDAAAEVCRAYAKAAASGLEAGEATETVLTGAFRALFRTAAETAESGPLRGQLLTYVVTHPGRLTAFLGDDVATPVQATPRYWPRDSAAPRSAQTSRSSPWRSSSCTPCSSAPAAPRHSAAPRARPRSAAWPSRSSSGA